MSPLFLVSKKRSYCVYVSGVPEIVVSTFERNILV